MGLERVLKASVPSLKRGNTIVLLVLIIFQASSKCWCGGKLLLFLFYIPKEEFGFCVS